MHARMQGMSPHIHICTLAKIVQLAYCIKETASVLLFSFEGAGESVSYSTSAEQDGERGGSGEGGTIPHMDKSERSCVAYCPSPSPDANCNGEDRRVRPSQ